MTSQTAVDAYIAGFPDWRGEAAATARDTILAVVPDARVSIKWSQPVFEANGPFAYIKVFRTSVNVGFWRGAELDDPDRRLRGDGDRMRHLKLTGPDQLDVDRLASWVRDAVERNRGSGDPTQRR
ncbi:MAG TPA: DUF1801 domain-containing protein [Candidatus Limnocylindrales bacterium]|jgi:hypothetical protein|nr:DUF1801 domain-containing protein [Candidatus Limnocylindrales bacterium]